MSPVCGTAFDLDETHFNGGVWVFGMRFTRNQVEAAIVSFDAFDFPTARLFVGNHVLHGNALNFSDRAPFHAICGDSCVPGAAWHSRAAKMLDVTNHTLGFTAQFCRSLLQPAIQFVEFVFDLLHVGGHKCLVAELAWTRESPPCANSNK